MSKKIIIIQFIFLAILVVIFIMYAKTSGRRSSPVSTIIPEPLKMSNFEKSKYSHINPAVLNNAGKHYIINFKPLKDSFIDVRSRYPNKTYVYFAYLNNASWVGLDEKEDFTAASTIKVPIAMAMMRAVEDKKIKLSDTYSLEELDLDQGFGDLYKVGADKVFLVGELLDIMLNKSDNTAMSALVTIFQRIGIDDPLSDVYGFLGWDMTQTIPEIGEVPDYSKINLKTLANIFLALYDAKYISIDNSNLILEHLASTDFDDRIRAGVPVDVFVVHKIGTASQDKTYSDCGIVYPPNRHYLLCVGSGGVDEKTAGKFIAEISDAAYKYVINN